MNKLTSKQSWITNELKTLITKRDAMFKKWIFSPSAIKRKPYRVQNYTQQSYSDDKDRKKAS